MRITIYLDLIEPISLNVVNKYRVQGKFVKTYKSKKAKELKNLIDQALKDKRNKESINQFNSYYDINKHYLNFTYRYYYPIFTKKGLISKTGGDTSNLIKFIEDCLFSHLDADDSQVIQVSATKIHSEEIKTVIEIDILDLTSIS